MLRRLASRQQCRLFHATPRCQAQNVIEIDNASFYRTFPSDTDTPDSNPVLFPGLSFDLPVTKGQDEKPEYWSVISPSSLARTTFLQILASQHICIPPTARRYPSLSEKQTPLHHAIKYVGFDAERGSSVGGNHVRGAYLSSRYESRREETDYTGWDYLKGHTELNALEHELTFHENWAMNYIVSQLDLSELLFLPVSNLSNGQTRRMRIAKALMGSPEVLLLDGPFMGLDPNTLFKMDKVLRRLAEQQEPRLIMSLRPEDDIPEWVSHLVVTDHNLQVLSKGPKSQVLRHPPEFLSHLAQSPGKRPWRKPFSKDGWELHSPALEPGEALVEMNGVRVAYGEKRTVGKWDLADDGPDGPAGAKLVWSATGVDERENVVLGDWKQKVHGEERSGLWWSLHRGQRAGIFGPNGSGKTTMLSLITSDHPQTYSLPIKLFGRSRLPGPGEPGISIFDIQRRMGHSSPEIHAFFPKQLTVRRAIESAWADAPLAKANLTAEADRKVDAFLRWFARELNPNHTDQTALEAVEEALQGPAGERCMPKRLATARKAYDDTMHNDSDLNWADDVRFRELSFSSQRLLLFLRALVSQPDLVILDEALSGIDERVRDKALLFLSHGEKISEVKDGIAEESVLAKLDKVCFEGLLPEQALLVISHSKEDVPGCIREWICLPEPGFGKVPRSGVLSGPLELNGKGWHEIWGRKKFKGDTIF